MFDAIKLAKAALGLLGKHWKLLLIAVLAINLGLTKGALQRSRTHAKAETARAETNYKNAMAWRDAVVGPKGWKAHAAKLEGLRETEGRQAARLIEAATTSKAKASSGAFNQGYAAGRAAGRLTCPGGSDAQPDPASGREPAPGGVRDNGDDFAALWRSGAGLGERAVPAEP